MTIRNAYITDLDTLENNFPQPYCGAHKLRIEKQFDGNYDYLLAVDDNVILGHLLIRWTGPVDEQARSQFRNPEISALFVSQNFRKKGIGTVLLLTAESRIIARGFNSCGLAVRSNNPAASLYYKRGYEYFCDALPIKKYPDVNRAYLVKKLIN